MKRVPHTRANGARQVRPVRVLLVTDVRLFQEALAGWCNRHASLHMEAADSDPERVIASARAHRPDIALIDMRAPEGADVASALARAVPAVRLVGLGLSETEDSVLAYAGAGFAGYVPRETTLQDLVAVLRGIARGEVRYSRKITTSLLQRLANLAGPNGHGVRLTVRESEIIQLIDEGLSNRDIARRLAIGLATVKNHVHNVLEKLQVHRRGEAAARLRHPRPIALDLKI